jgi:bis(5'-nucleosyl)-tetraphosphatase (symmetrical)
MALYLIGDLQGCDGALAQLLAKIDFSPSRDTLFFLGDLVNRGPDSAGVLRRLMALGGAAQCLLGNHDMHLLAAAEGVRKPGRLDTLQTVLDAPDREAMLLWVRHQRMAILKNDCLMVHAGVLPSWTATETIALATEVETVLQSRDLPAFLHEMYGNQPAAWDAQLTGHTRLRVIVNALTRLRYCTVEGAMAFETPAMGLPTDNAEGLMPWFDAPHRRTANVTVAFGHWSTLGWLPDRPNLLSLDSGCVWGGKLSALRLGATVSDRELIQVQCAQSQAPGKD